MESAARVKTKETLGDNWALGFAPLHYTNLTRLCLKGRLLEEDDRNYLAIDIARTFVTIIIIIIITIGFNSSTLDFFVVFLYQPPKTISIYSQFG